MSNFNNIVEEIKVNIRPNANQEITGLTLRNVLLEIIQTFSTGYMFRGFAVPTGSPIYGDYNFFYVAIRPGKYTNFGGFEVKNYSFLCYDSAWHLFDTDIPFDILSQANVKQEIGISERDVMSQNAVTVYGKEIIKLFTWKNF